MEGLEQKLSYRFRDRKLLDEALSHSSYVNEHRGSGIFSNERLEFLGDSVLGFVTAEFLFRQHPTAPEGDLTRIRAALVCEQSLYEVAQKLELGKYLKLGRGEEAGGGRTRPSILADATERRRDYHPALQELVQRQAHQELSYRMAGEEGPDHDKTFLAEVLLNGQLIGQGRGHSKKEAEQNAAAAALETHFAGN